MQKVLIANRGEIAVRVLRTCKLLGLKTVAVYSDVDRAALHVRYADEAFCLGPPDPASSYLNVEKLLDVAKRSGADAVHPGYGFLSENELFAQAVISAGLIFVGPAPKAMWAMGDKVRSRLTMQQANVPVVPGTGRITDTALALQKAMEMGYPVLLKASAGGGGKGMRRVEREQDFIPAFERASSEAARAFGDGGMYVEKYLLSPHHIEFQIFADTHGNVVHMFERECSIQRRHQKIIEETPSPFLDDMLRQKMGQIAVRAARAIQYTGAGTVEFLVDGNRNFYFLEMNTRLQVEHPVTEAVTHLDLVREQFLVAQGQPLSVTQDQIVSRGAAIEARIYAEDPDNNFMPTPGTITAWDLTGGPGVREDAGVYAGFTVPYQYDPLLSKLIAWGSHRGEALSRMRLALNEKVAGGITTNLGFLQRVLMHPDFVAGRYDTHFIPDRPELLERRTATPEADFAPVAAALARHLERHRTTQNVTPPVGVSAWRRAYLP